METAMHFWDQGNAFTATSAVAMYIHTRGLSYHEVVHNYLM